MGKETEYKICLLLAKYYYSNGEDTVIKIRNKLKSWAKEHNFYFKVAMNPIATKVIENDMKIAEDVSIFISDEDISTIDESFDTYEERLIALSVLCYAKRYADANGEFQLSKSSLAIWTNLNRRTVAKHMKTLEDVGYIEKVNGGTTKSWYSTTVVTTLDKYKINAPFFNVGYFEINDNDIIGLYHRIFSGIDIASEVWFDIPGYQDIYQISSSMNVRVKDRVVCGRKLKGKLLKPNNSKSGKIYYNLSDGSSKQVKKSADFLYNLASEK